LDWRWQLVGKLEAVQKQGCEKFGSWSDSQLLKNPVSDNVGGVKQFSSTLQHALGEERHFALVDGFAFANRRLAS